MAERGSEAPSIGRRIRDRREADSAGSVVEFATRSVLATRRIVYLVVLPPTVVAAVVAWWAGMVVGTVELSPAGIVGLPIVAAAGLAAVVALLVRPGATRWVEYTLLGLFSLYLAISLVVVSSEWFHTDNEGLEAVARLGYWFPPLYGMAFLILGTWLGLAYSLAVWSVGLVVGVGHFLSPAGHAEGELVLLAQMYVSNVVMLVMLFAISNIVRIQTRSASALDVEANTDALTGLPNRRGGAVLFFDLDHFKVVNDRLGHEVGDRVLQTIGPLLSRHLRSVDTLGRWGGEEFLVIVPETGSVAAAALAERLRSVIEGGDFPASERLTASFGVTSARPDDTPAAMVKRVDRTLYRAKSGGRNRVEVEREVDRPVRGEAAEAPTG